MILPYYHFYVREAVFWLMPGTNTAGVHYSSYFVLLTNRRNRGAKRRWRYITGIIP